ncbi:hypothetical protein [Mycobacterium phage WXIN]|nr:hypothetical protein [Mycobacterium phage WXIN]
MAEVIADSESEAMEVVSDGCFSYNDIDFERNDVDGVDVEMA